MLNIIYTKKDIKKTLIQKQLKDLNKFIIYLPNGNKKKVSRLNKSKFLKIHNNILIKTIPANSLISDLHFNNINIQELKPILLFSNNLYLLPNQIFILNNLNNYKKILTIGYFYIKLILILKVFSVKKN